MIYSKEHLFCKDEDKQLRRDPKCVMVKCHKCGKSTPEKSPDMVFPTYKDEFKDIKLESGLFVRKLVRVIDDPGGVLCWDCGANRRIENY